MHWDSCARPGLLQFGDSKREPMENPGHVSTRRWSGMPPGNLTVNITGALYPERQSFLCGCWVVGRPRASRDPIPEPSHPCATPDWV